jgi:hypothetical protein
VRSGAAAQVIPEQIQIASYFLERQAEASSSYSVLLTPAE